MLGSDMVDVFSDLNLHVFPRQRLDITNSKLIDSILHPLMLDVVINCAAYTNVDGCETHIQEAMDINCHGVGNLVDFCFDNDVCLIHFSTDYVFDGRQSDPYTELDQTNPINIYGHSKLKAELCIAQRLTQYYIFRIQWLYGQNGAHFIKTILRLSQTKDQLDIVDDQWGSPTWTRDVAQAVKSILKKQLVPYGIYHMSSSSYTNWFSFAKFFLTLTHHDIMLNPVPAVNFDRPAPRPQNSRLSVNKLNEQGIYLPSWQDAVTQFLS